MSAPSSYLAEEKAIAPRGTRGPSNIPSYVFQLKKRHIILVFILSSQNNPCHEMLKHVCTSYVETFPAADVTVVVFHDPTVALYISCSIFEINAGKDTTTRLSL